MFFVFGIMVGCVIFLVMFFWFKGNIKWILFVLLILMILGCGLLVIVRVDNI